MSLLDLLRKLGILRYGATAGAYRNGAERPTELMMDDVYDANKDLVVVAAVPRQDHPRRCARRRLATRWGVSSGRERR